MKRFFSQKVILAVLSICILAVSIGLFAASPDEALDHCLNVCEKYFEMPTAWYACLNGCLFGAGY